MAELSQTTGVPVPTIKFYIREGLVPAGTPTGRNQADYVQEHVRRLRLVRALTQYGMAVSVVRELVAALDDPDLPLFLLLGAAQKTITEVVEPPSGPSREKAERRMLELLSARGWQTEPLDAGTRAAIGVLATLDELGRQDVIDRLDDYMAAAEQLALADLRALGDVSDRERAIELVIIGTALGDALTAALRRIAQANLARPFLDAEP